MEIIPKPWGFEKILFDGPLYIVKELHIDAGKRISLQYHPLKTETMFLASGVGWIMVAHKNNTEELTEKLAADTAYNVVPLVNHRIGAYPDGPVVILEVSTPHKGETSTVRLQDDFKRVV